MNASLVVDERQERRLLNIAEAVEILGVGKTTIFGLIKSADLFSVKIGHRTLIPIEEIDRFVDCLVARSTSKASVQS